MTQIPLKVAPNGFVDKLAWTPVRDRAVLFARSRSQPLIFYCVGGKRDTKPDGTTETDVEALVREVLEETGVVLKPETIRFVHTFNGPTHGYVAGTVTRIACYFGEGDTDPVPSSEIAELRYLTTADTACTTELGHEILQWFHSQGLID